MADDVTINIRTRGARQAARETKDVAAGVGAIGRQARTAAGGMRTLRQNSTLASGSLSAVRRGSVAAGAGLLGLGAVSVRMGLQFNASMEQNQVAFTQFLGSSQAARRELKYLYKTAAATPFEVPQITMAARRLLAFNFSARESNSWLQTIGDTAAGAGQGADGIDRLVTAIGQIRAKGRLQGDELLQLSELGVLDPASSPSDLGITQAELFGGNANISSRRALRALKAQFDDTFGGQSAKQARTFNGQISTLHDNLNMTLGKLTRPAFRDIEKTSGRSSATSSRSSNTRASVTASGERSGWRPRRSPTPLRRSRRAPPTSSSRRGSPPGLGASS
jgi:phage tail tape-measure protein